MVTERRRLLLEVLHAGLRELEGGHQVRQYLESQPLQDAARTWHLLAVGKAARTMSAGAVSHLGEALGSGLVIHPRGEESPLLPAAFECRGAEHPIPGAGSFQAGERVLEFLQELPRSDGLLVLLSGGGSALMESPLSGVSRSWVEEAHRWLLASGLDIVQMNRVRQTLSAVKGGKLVPFAPDGPVQVLALSDVPESFPEALASGPFLPPLAGPLPQGLPDWLAPAVMKAEQAPPGASRSIPHEILADSREAGKVFVDILRHFGVVAELAPERMTGAVPDMASHIASHIPPPGQARIWWGETQLAVPREGGRGGRCQHLALEVARQLAGRPGWSLLAVGTDGRDGNSEDAGALVDGGSLQRGRDAGMDPDQALSEYRSGDFLEAAGDLVQTGPTGTNLNEVVVALGTEEAL